MYDAGPPRLLAELLISTTDIKQKAGFGFIRSDADGPTYLFRWNEIEIDGYFKSLPVGARVRFDARIDHAGQRYALSVVPHG
jgi:cold shock CspA family protein